MANVNGPPQSTFGFNSPVSGAFVANAFWLLLGFVMRCGEDVQNRRLRVVHDEMGTRFS